MLSPGANAWTRRLLLAALSPWLLYLVAAHLFLNTPLSSWAINRRPDRFHLDWAVGLTPWPGLVHLRGVEMRGRSRAIRWSVDIDSVTIPFQVRPLFERRVHLDRVRAHGAVYRQRPRLAPDFPPMAELPELSGARAEASRPKQPPTKPWRILAERIDSDLRQVWINRYRMEGNMRASTRLDLTVRGALDLGEVKFESSSGGMWAGDEPVFEEFSMLAEVHLEPIKLRGRAPGEVMRGLSGDFVVEARRATFGFLEAYFRKAPWLQFNGTGPLKIDVKVRNGALMPGTHFRLDRERMDSVFLGRRLTGSGYVEAGVETERGRPVCRLTAAIGEFQVTEVGEKDPYIRGSDFKVTATSSALSLSEPFTDLHLTLELPESEIPDLAFYNRYIPPDSGISIDSGAGRIRFRFEGSPEERSLRGEIEIGMQDLRLKVEEIVFSGDLKISTKLRNGSPRDLHFDISGTRIDLRSADPIWRGHIELRKADMWFTEPARVDARVGLALQDTRPIVRLFDAHRDVPDWIERLMTIQSLAGGAALGVDGTAIDVTGLEVTGKGLRALADLRFAEGGRSGVLYIRFHGFSLGVERAEGKRDLKMLRPLSWFEKERAARTQARPR
jgi:hypothetical protein